MGKPEVCLMWYDRHWYVQMFLLRGEEWSQQLQQTVSGSDLRNWMLTPLTIKNSNSRWCGWNRNKGSNDYWLVIILGSMVSSESLNEFKVYIFIFKISKEEVMKIGCRMINSGRERMWYGRCGQRMSNWDLGTNKQQDVISSYNVDVLDLYRVFWVLSQTDLQKPLISVCLLCNKER